MADQRNRYKQLEQIIGLALLGAFALFIFYWIAAGNEIVWLKVVLSVMIFLVSGASLGYLYISQELLRKRSLWMSLGFAAIIVCLLFSLILHFPCPNPRTQQSTIDALAALTIYF